MMDKNLSQKDYNKKTFLDSWFAKNVLPPCLLSLITFLIYYPSFNYPFQFDDVISITKYFHIRSDNPFGNFRRGRWFSNWLNCMNYKIGYFNPFYYRIVNIFIHLLAGLALFILLYNLCKLLKKRPFFYDNAHLISAVASGFFLLHPVQTQTVSYIIQARLEGIAGLFVLISLSFFVGMFRSEKKYFKIGSGIFFVIFSILSCATKETVVVIPFLAVVLDWFFISQEEWSTFKSHLKWYGLLFVGFLLLISRYVGTQFLLELIQFKAIVPNNLGNILTADITYDITAYDFFISQFKVIWHYAAIFFWPFSMSVEYDWKLSPNIFSPDSLIPGLALLLVLGTVIKNIIQKKGFIYNVGIIWFLLCLAPRCSVFPAPELVCDYKTYLASVGIFFMLAPAIITGFYKLYDVIKDFSLTRFFGGRDHAVITMIIVALLPIGFTSMMRNRIWRSHVAFWESNVKYAPNKARTQNNYGTALAEDNQVDEAIEAFKKAIDLDPYYQDPISNIAVTYSMKGDSDNAIRYLYKAIEMYPNYAEAYNNLGSVYIDRKEFDNAEAALKKAVEIRPWYGKAYFNLARIAELKRDSQQVWEYMKKVVEGDFDTTENLFKFGLASLAINKFDEAEKTFEKMVQRESGVTNPEAWFNLGNAYYMLRKYENAKQVYSKLAAENPEDSRFVFNYAETLFTMGKYEEALIQFQKVTELKHHLDHAYARIPQCLEKLNNYEGALHTLQHFAQLPDKGDQFKEMLESEKIRISLQAKLNEGNGSIKLSELKTALAKG